MQRHSSGAEEASAPVLDLVDFHVLMARHPDLAHTIDAEAERRARENK